LSFCNDAISKTENAEGVPHALITKLSLCGL
jgi:hypothetical protein